MSEYTYFIIILTTPLTKGCQKCGKTPGIELLCFVIMHKKLITPTTLSWVNQGEGLGNYLIIR